MGLYTVSRSCFAICDDTGGIVLPDRALRNNRSNEANLFPSNFAILVSKFESKIESPSFPNSFGFKAEVFEWNPDMYIPVNKSKAFVLLFLDAVIALPAE